MRRQVVKNRDIKNYDKISLVQEKGCKRKGSSPGVLCSVFNKGVKGKDVKDKDVLSF